MLEVRKADSRGLASLDWLNSRHTFSFGHYYDPAHMGFGVLRVINEDRVAPGRGFDTHGHRDMEILSYVLEGALEHRDSMGTGSIIRPGDVQRMSAGTGVRHSEFNASGSDPVHFLQIWVLPERAGLAPGYEQKTFSDDQKRGRFRLLASRQGREGSVSMNQDLDLHAGVIGAGESLSHTLVEGRQGWIYVARGEVTVAGEALQAGDGLGITDAGRIDLGGDSTAEVLLFDMRAGAAS